MNKLEYNIENFNFLIGENRKQAELLEAFRSEIASLKHTLEQFKRMIFGPKSERLVELPAGMPDLPGMVLPEAAAPAEKPVTVPEHTRRSSGSGKGEFTLDLPGDLPRETEVIDISPADKLDPETGEELVVIGKDVSEKLAYQPDYYFVKVTERLKYGKRNDPLFGVLQMPAPPSILEGSKFDPSFLAHVVTEKFAYHMPLNRQLEKLALHGIRISPQQMSSLVLTLGGKVMPLVQFMEQKAFGQRVIFTDDTPVKLAGNGRKCRQAHMWIYLAGKPNAPPWHLYKFSNGRSHKFPKEHLKKFRGVIHADAFPAYEDLDADPDSGVVWAACWAHARRKFFELGPASEEGREVIRRMRNLFRYERVAWRCDAERRLEIRTERETPLVDDLFKYLKDLVRRARFLPKSKTAEAVGYMQTREKNFRRYLSDPDIRMDNNPSERALRKVVVGRNNWLFVGSERGGAAAAALLSLVQTCRAMNIDPQEYLADIFTRLLDHPARRIAELLPDQWRELCRKKSDAENQE